MNKAWYKSKTVWTNIIALIGVIFFSKEFDAATVGIVLTVVNFLLRLITKENVAWTD